MAFLWAALLTVAVAAGWLMTLVGMPGNWLIVACTACYAALGPAETRLAIGWPVVGILAGLALLGELIEIVAGALGVAKAGGSRRSAVLALLGSMIGGIAGLFVGLPVPIVGSLLAAVVFAGAGALVGAAIGESWKGRDLDRSLEVGVAAFWGRLLGTLAKTLVASVMAGVVLAALLLD